MTTPIKLLIIFGAMMAAGIICAIIGIIVESRLYNKGVCRWCHQNLIFFDYDSHGGRGYECTLCGNKIWVSYDIVDKHLKKFKEETK